LKDTTVKCWGSSGNGEGGYAYEDRSVIPRTIPGLTGVKNVSLSMSHACAVLMDGTVKCWGNAGEGKLGTGSPSCVASGCMTLTPTTVPGLSGVIAVTTGFSFSCALLSNGTVTCWGRNQQGQLGNSSGMNSVNPVPVAGLSGVTTIASGDPVAFDGDHTCALLGDGTLKGWGANKAGQIGIGSSGAAPVTTPTTVVKAGP
jgi:alpha-tubulin suppressor-like RCC1 family protein